MKLIVDIPDEEYKSYTFLSNIGMGSTAIRRILDGKPYEECKLDIIGLDKQIDNCKTEGSIMPMSCKCILNRMVFKGAMTEREREKIMRNIKTDTCTNDGKDCSEYDQFVCSKCGIELLDWTRYIGDECYEYAFKFCPNCGRKIVEGAEE